MQKSAFWLSMLLVLLGSCPSGNAEEPQLSRTERLTKLIQGLSNSNDGIREGSAQLIKTTMLLTIQYMWTNDGIKKHEFPKKMRDTLEHSRNDLVKILKQPNIDLSDHSVGACLMCLALVKDDGSVLRHAIQNELHGNAIIELAAIQTLLSTTPYTLSNEASIVSSFLSDIRHLSPRARAAFKVPATSELDHAVKKFRFVGLGNVLVHTDRTLREIPHLIEGLNDKYPLVVRSLVMEALGELGEESSKALPKLKELLEDDSEELRRAAAYAIVRIQPMYDVEKFAEFFQLYPVGGKRFLEWLSKVGKEASNVDDISEDAILQSLESPNSFYQRKALRLALRGAPISPASHTRIHKLLNTATDRETRELARQALEK